MKDSNTFDVTYGEEKLEENDTPLLDRTADIITPPFDYIISLFNTTSLHEAWVVAPPPLKTVSLKRALVEIPGEAEASSEKAPVMVIDSKSTHPANEASRTWIILLSPLILSLHSFSSLDAFLSSLD
ncbi:hypothetical protein Tco_0133001 [Tanacetum coccineum]